MNAGIVTTSYDYDAPLSEAGDPTPKYFAVRDTIANLTGRTPRSVPPATPKVNYGSVPTQLLGEVTVLLDALSPERTRILSLHPKTFEQIDFPYGFLLYETVLQQTVGNNLSIPGIKDRGHIMINGDMQGVVKASGGKTWLPLSAEKSSKLQILVENGGRECSGYNDPKGIIGDVIADGGVVLTNWTIYPLSIENIFNALKNVHERNALKKKVKAALKERTLSLRKDETGSKKFAPSIYYAKFSAEGNLSDTFFNPQNWSKGQMFINEFNVGRYWPSLGPQVTLYVPKSALVNLNYVVILELEYPGNCRDGDNFTCNVSFIDKPIIDKPVIGQIKSLNMYRKSIYMKNKIM